MESSEKKKILLICVNSNNITGFRRALIEKLQKEGNQVSAIAFDDENQEEIQKLGVDFYCVKDRNRGTNPLKILSLKKKYLKIIKEVNPDIVFTFMMKPNIFGVKAAKKAKVENIYSMVEGAGDVFIHNTLKWKLIRFLVCRLYRSSFKYSQKVFFLNQDDRKEFLTRKLIKESQCEIIYGIGVDLVKFSFKPIKNHATFLMIARMLKAKGVIEYCQVARSIRKRYPWAQFHYIGGEGTVTVADIQEYIDDGSVRYFGQTNDVRPYLENSTVFVLPSSYREGLPASIMEAASSGRAIITNDGPGCRETVETGFNGFLVKDGEELEEKIAYFIENPEEEIRMGENSRKFAETHFDQEKINNRICEVIINGK